MRYGAIEAGGTKFNCAVSDENFKIIDQVQFPTTDPDETLKHVFDFFDQHDLTAMGIGSFGPIDVLEDSETYGYITQTPKLPWRHFDFLGAVKDRYEIPVYWTTDVNSSAYGEYQAGAGKDLSSCLYLTVGTGVGGGAISQGEFLTGFSHPEMGHIQVAKDPQDTYEGFCVTHGDCLEGLVAGPSIGNRFGEGVKAQDLDPEDPVWDYVANYLGQALHNYALILTPERIIMGGGVMHKPGLLEKVRQSFEAGWGDYMELPHSLEDYIVSPGLGDDAGLIGCLYLAEKAWKEAQ